MSLSVGEVAVDNGANAVLETPEGETRRGRLEGTAIEKKGWIFA
jgi:hypothetical protein